MVLGLSLEVQIKSSPMGQCEQALVGEMPSLYWQNRFQTLGRDGEAEGYENEGLTHPAGLSVFIGARQKNLREGHGRHEEEQRYSHSSNDTRRAGIQAPREQGLLSVPVPG